jgi:hypothetical protein
MVHLCFIRTYSCVTASAVFKLKLPSMTILTISLYSMETHVRVSIVRLDVVFNDSEAVVTDYTTLSRGCTVNR